MGTATGYLGMGYGKATLGPALGSSLSAGEEHLTSSHTPELEGGGGCMSQYLGEQTRGSITRGFAGRVTGSCCFTLGAGRAGAAPPGEGLLLCQTLHLPVSLAFSSFLPGPVS